MTPQIHNRTIFTGDNLPILRGMNTESIDLVYLDPPFNSNRHYEAPVGSKAAGAAFKDAWTLDDVDVAWLELIKTHYPAIEKIINAAGDVGGRGDKSYLVYMAIRLLELRRILKSSGSIYLHCDPTMSHSLKLVMDAIFGKKNFVNEVVWCYRKWTNAAHRFQKNHDVVLYYCKSWESHVFNKLYDPDSPQKIHYQRGWHTNVVEGGVRQLIVYDKTKAAHKIKQDKYDRIVYREGHTGVAMSDWWNMSILNSQARERTGYPTQKPLTLLERIIQASSNAGDMVLDPFCGCATTCIAAEKHARHWIGIDISAKAMELVKTRLHKDLAIGDEEGQTVFTEKVIHRTDIPKRSEHGLTRSPKIKQALYGQQEGMCNGCRTHFPMRNMEVDHIVPKSHGGQDTDDNLQLLCGACNRTKSTGTMADLMARLAA